MQKSITYTFPNGEVLELFYIGELAYRLGRASETVRKWEIQGVIPETIFRDKAGKRLYSGRQMQIIVEEAEKAQIGQGKAVCRTNFTDNCTQRIKELNDFYKSQMKAGESSGQ